MDKVAYLLLSMIAVDTVIGKLHLVDFGINPWEMYGICLLFQMFIMSSVIFLIVPYKHLAAKTFAILFMLSEAWEIIHYFSNETYGVLFVVDVIIFVPWFLYAWRRSYDVDEARALMPNRIYRMTHAPDEKLGFIMSLCEDPVAGSGFYINGNMYMFHKDYFRKVKKLPMDWVLLDSGIDSNAKIEAYLESKLGTRWSLFGNVWLFLGNNCVTTWREVRRGTCGGIT